MLPKLGHPHRGAEPVVAQVPPTAMGGFVVFHQPSADLTAQMAGFKARSCVAFGRLEEQELRDGCCAQAEVHLVLWVNG